MNTNQNGESGHTMTAVEAVLDEVIASYSITAITIDLYAKANAPTPVADVQAFVEYNAQAALAYQVKALIQNGNLHESELVAFLEEALVSELIEKPLGYEAAVTLCKRLINAHQTGEVGEPNRKSRKLELKRP